MVSFTEQKLLSSMWPHSFIFPLCLGILNRASKLRAQNNPRLDGNLPGPKWLPLVLAVAEVLLVSAPVGLTLQLVVLTRYGYVAEQGQQGGRHSGG